MIIDSQIANKDRGSRSDIVREKVSFNQYDNKKDRIQLYLLVTRCILQQYWSGAIPKSTYTDSCSTPLIDATLDNCFMRLQLSCYYPLYFNDQNRLITQFVFTKNISSCS